MVEAGALLEVRELVVLESTLTASLESRVKLVVGSVGSVSGSLEDKKESKVKVNGK